MGLCLRADLGSGKSEVCLQRRELGGGQRRVAREQLQRGVVGALAEPTRVTCPPSRLEPGRPLGGRRVLVSGPEIWLSPPPPVLPGARMPQRPWDPAQTWGKIRGTPMAPGLSGSGPPGCPG